jgi:hypothetical protein
MGVELIRNKYLHSKTLAQVTLNAFDSPFWKEILKVRDDFFRRGHFQVGNGLGTRFWEDTWLGDGLLALQYPFLYNIIQRKKFMLLMCCLITH